MKKGLIVVLVLAGVALALGGYYLSKKSQKTENLNLEEATEPTPGATPDASQTTPPTQESETPPDSGALTQPSDEGQSNAGTVTDVPKEEDLGSDDIPEEEPEEDIDDY